MFWRFGGYANISSIDTILDKQDVTLEELLDENDVIQELKAQNAKLIEFMRDDAVLAKLLQYVIAQPKVQPAADRGASPEPVEQGSRGFFGKSRSKTRSKSREKEDDPDKEEAQRKKYSYVSSEILASEVWSITESLLESPDHLREFWGFIKRDAPLDNLQASYFTKVNEALLEKKPGEMVGFITSLNGTIPHLMKHVDCPVVMDLLLKLISLEKESAAQGVVDWLQQQDLIPILLSFVSPDHSAATQTSAGDFLKAIITISANATGQDASVIGPNELTRQLVSEEAVTSLLDDMLQGGNPLTAGVGIIIEVIRKNNSDYDSDSQIGPEPKSSDPIYLGSLLRIFAAAVPKFMEMILSPEHTVAVEDGVKRVQRQNLETAWGDKIEPLGFDRFKICELMAELLHCSNMGLLNEKGSEDEIRKRDVEREKLKAEGALVSNIQTKDSTEHGGDPDSPGLHDQEFSSPLGGSPQDIRPLEVQNNVDEEEFEKVTKSEAISDEAVDEDSRPAVGGRFNRDDESDNDLTKNLDEIDLLNDSMTSEMETEEEAPALPKRPGVQGEAGVDKPAPLFVKSRDQASLAANEDSDESPGADPLAAKSGEDEADETEPGIQRNEDGSPVVGDLLKMMFVEHRTVPTILDFFFRFPWNNFLHNVVYDVVQQVFNGSMDRGFNRSLAIDLFETGQITNRIVEGQKRSDKAQQEQKLRLGYMGHLTLIAEEVVKFTERQPAEQLSQSVVDKVSDPEWIHYVEHTLAETRERDNTVLGGVKPDQALGPRQAVLNAVNASHGGLGSSALANAGLAGNSSAPLDSIDLGNAGAAGYGLNASSALLSDFGSSDDEDEDELEEGEMGTDDAFQRQRTIDDEDQLSTSQPINIPPQPSSEPPPIPAPLAIPPSRARRQLAVRLAEKQRLAIGDASASSADEPSGEIDDAFGERGAVKSTEAAIVTATATATAPASGGVRVPRRYNPPSNLGDASFPDVESAEQGQGFEGGAIRRGFTNDFTGTEEGSSDDGYGSFAKASKGSEDDDTEEWEDDEDEDEEDAPPPGIKRQTTREAAERRPLDEEDDSEEEENTEEESSEDSDAEVATPTASAATGTTTARSAPQTQPTAGRRPSLDTAAAAAEAKAKRIEQEKLLRQWGFAEEDADSDDDDEPVQLGSRFLARRRGEQS